MKNSYKNFIVFFFLLSFLTLRIVSFHVISHLDENHIALNCEECEIISVTNKVTPIADGVREQSFKTLENNILQDKTLFNYKEPTFKSILAHTFLNKPPPFI